MGICESKKNTSNSKNTTINNSNIINLSRNSSNNNNYHKITPILSTNSLKNKNISPTSSTILSTNQNTNSFQKHSFNVSMDEAKQFLLNKCNISPFILDDQGNAVTGWRINKKSGPPGYLKDYIPPIGWTGIGLKVVNIYDKMDNAWIGINNSVGEWYIGYHGVHTIEAIQNIYNEGFRRGNIKILLISIH